MLSPIKKKFEPVLRIESFVNFEYPHMATKGTTIRMSVRSHWMQTSSRV